MDNYVAAIQDLNKTIQLNIEYVDAYYYRGLSKFESNDLTGACLDWSKALELGYKEASEAINTYCK